MTVIDLYRYYDEHGTVITPIQRDPSDEPYEKRLVADEGKVLTNGEINAYCIDTHNPEEWTEIDDPEPPENKSEQEGEQEE